MEIEKKRECGAQRLLLSETESTEKIREDLFGGGKEKLYGEEREDFRERMMLENEIHGHIPFRIRRINGRKTFEYDIDGLSSLEEEAERKLGIETIRTLARGLSDVVAAGAPFLLREDDYVITPGTVFFDKKDRNLKLVYCPGYGQNLKTNLVSLMEYCLDTVDYSDEAAVQSVYGLYMKARDGSSLQQMKEVVIYSGESAICEGESTLSEKGTLETKLFEGKQVETKSIETRRIKTKPIEANRIEPKQTEKEATETNRVVASRVTIENSYDFKYPDDGPNMPEVQLSFIEKIREFAQIVNREIRLRIVICIAVYVVLLIAVISGKIEFFSRKFFGIPAAIPVMVAATAVCALIIARTMVPAIRKFSKKGERKEEPDDNETVLMIGNGTEESLVLVSDVMPGLRTDRFPCTVGKDEGTCDLVVDAKGVSRKHLKFERSIGGGICVEDLNTINGTFLNGHKLAPNMRFEVREGDEISFGSVSYYVNHLS